MSKMPTRIREDHRCPSCGDTVVVTMTIREGTAEPSAVWLESKPSSQPRSAVTTCYARPEETVPEAPAEQGVMPACVGTGTPRAGWRCGACQRVSDRKWDMCPHCGEGAQDESNP
jgi:RNA polymerase subunit RPABC4/transcription elongation factor Spt4